MATSGDNSKEDAKFLIDQFNKFAAWRIAQAQFEFSWYVVFLALTAVLVSLVSLYWVYFKPPSWLAFVFALFIVLSIGGVVILMGRDYNALRRKHRDDANRLLILEQHYSRFESLPHMTLREITDFKPEDLRKHLKENEPSTTGSAKT
jgi:glucan phosphoethanolaminetransferase (alkaline phosphatase superfamily)